MPRLRRLAPLLLLGLALACAAGRRAGVRGRWPAACALGAAGLLSLVAARGLEQRRLSALDAIIAGSASGRCWPSSRRPAPRPWRRRGRGRDRARRAGAATAPSARAAGLAALAVAPLGVVVAAPAFALAVLRPGPSAGPGPEFKPVVLRRDPRSVRPCRSALLTAGQFEALEGITVALASVTVLAGMARAGLTVVEQLRESRRLASRTTSRPGQPASPDRAAARRARHGGGRGHGAGAAADRPRRLQGAQRHARPSRRRRGAAPDRAAAPAPAARAGHARAAGRGRVRGRARRRATRRPPAPRAAAARARSSTRSRSATSGCTSTPASASRSSRSTPTDPLGLLQRADVAMYEAKRLRTGHEVYLAARDRHSRQRLALIGELHGALKRGRARRALPAQGATWRRAPCAASRRSCAGSTRRAACSARASSCR